VELIYFDRHQGRESVIVWERQVDRQWRIKDKDRSLLNKLKKDRVRDKQ